MTAQRQHVNAFLAGPWALFLLAFLLRVAFIGHESLWDDEAMTIRDSVKSISDIVTHRWDPHPPLYYILLHYWLELGQGDAFARFPSVVFGSLSVLFLYGIVAFLVSRPLAWFVALLLAVSPLHIWYSQEVRMYAMLVMWGLASTYFWLLLLRRQKRRLWQWLGYVTVTILGLYTHYTMGLVVVAQNVYVIASWFSYSERRQSSFIMGWVAAQLSLVILYVPWLPVLSDHWQVIRESRGYPLWILSTTPALLGMAVGLVVLLAVLVVWFRQTMVLEATGRHRFLSIMLLLTAAVYLIFMLLAMTNRATTLKRQTLVLFPYLCLLLGVLLVSTQRRWRGWMLGLVAITLLGTVTNSITYQKPRWREVVALVEAEAADTDAVVLNPAWMQTVFDYYSVARLPVVRIDPNNDGAEKLTGNYQEAWLIINKKFEPWEDPGLAMRAWFSAKFELAAQQQLGELEVLHYHLQSTASRSIRSFLASDQRTSGTSPNVMEPVPLRQSFVSIMP